MSFEHSKQIHTCFWGSSCCLYISFDINYNLINIFFFRTLGIDGMERDMPRHYPIMIAIPYIVSPLLLINLSGRVLLTLKNYYCSFQIRTPDHEYLKLWEYVIRRFPGNHQRHFGNQSLVLSTYFT